MMYRYALILVVAFVTGLQIQASSYGLTITNYFVPCEGGVLTDISTVHPYYGTSTYTDDRRRSYDVQCYDENLSFIPFDNVLSPTGGKVITVGTDTSSEGNYFLDIRDTANDVCLSVYHLGQINVTQGQQVELGTLLGAYGAGQHVHFTAWDGDCVAGGTWLNDPYKERPISFVEVGSPLNGTTSYSDAPAPFRSQNTPRAPSVDLAWFFDEGVPQGWTAINDLAGVKPLDGGMWAVITGDDPVYYSPQLLPFNAADYDRARIHLSTESERCLELFWRSPGEDFTGAKRKVVPFQGSTTVVTIPLSSGDNWAGVVDRLRVDPSCGMDTPPEDFVNLRSVELLRADNSTSRIHHINWDFGLDVPQGWQPITDLIGVTQLNGGMWADVTGSDPVYYSPAFEPFEATNFNRLTFSMGTLEAECIEFFWRNVNEEFNGTQRIVYDINRSGTYTLNLDDDPDWTGMIELLRFDPACRADPDTSDSGVNIYSIELWYEFSADVNEDGIISPTDLVYVINRLGQNDTTADVNRDGFVNGNDVTYIQDRLGP